ncbi:MAG: hypothetical protein HEP80_02675 [Dolichospermum sp. UKL201]|nr:MAG: hypothetical protein HEP80_02675 [Dolichospermum sp. UKL201]
MSSIALAVSPSSVLEDGTTNLVYTFTRTGVTNTAITVNFGVAGTAIFNNDYTQTGATTFTGTTGTINFAANETTKTITIDPTADTIVEIDETVALTLATGAGYTIATPAAVTGTITNEDTSIALAVSPSSVLEDGTTNLVYTFTRTGVTNTAITVNFGVAGTATFNNDYTQTGATSFTGGTINFAANETTKTITIDPTADTIVESNETVALTLLAGTGYNNIATPAAVTGTITNDDTSIALAVSPSSVLEDGTTNLVYTFTRTGVTNTAITVNFGVAGTATFNNDYTQAGATTFTGTTGTINFAANETTKTITIDPTADTIVESNETVALTLLAGTGYNNIATPAAVTGTITNDDTSIALAVSPSSVLEDGTTNLVYTFTRTGVTNTAITVNFGVAGTATFNNDYTQAGATSFTGGTINFAANETTKTITIDPTADTIVESNETVALTLLAGTGYNNIATPAAVTGTITNDDTSIALAVSPSSVLEDGTTNLVYTFTRTGVTNTAITVNFGVAGTATFNNDYTQAGATTFTGTTGTINFAANETTKTITIDPTADTIVESNETVALTLLAGTGYNNIATPAAVTGTITNDDTSIALAVSPSSVLEDGTTNLVYTFTRTGVTNTAITVNFGVAGTATFNNDYTQAGATTFTGTTGTINFAANETTKTITIDPTADTIVESNETVALTLLAGTGYNNIATPAAVTGTITNDDTPIINLSPDQKILEGETNPQNVTYTVTLSTSSTQTITVNYATADGTATAGLDYTSTNGTLTFAPGITTRTINIPILNDNLNEADETFTLTLTSPTNVNLGTKTSATTTITDTLTSSVTTTLPAGVENLTLTGTTAINGKGNDSNNILNGNSVNNTLTASAGNDILTGGDGVDTVDYSQLATSITLQAQGTVNKGSLGTDTVQAEVFIGNAAFANAIDAASSTNNRINANLSQNSLKVFGLPSGDVTFTVVNFKNVTGSQGSDTITGNNLDNTLNGSGGNDTLIASAGNDTLTGGNGVDTVDYSQLATSITLQAQGTVNKGSLGTDTVQAEVFIGNAAFANVIDAASSTNNRINADLSQNSLKVFGLPSGDVTFTVVNFKNVTGSQGSDTITGNNLDNTLNGSGGNDTLIASAGNDTLTGGNGVDTVDYSQLATSITLQAQGTVNKGSLGTDTVQAEVFIGNTAFANVINAASSTNNPINADLSQNSLTVFGLPSGDVTFTVVNFKNVTGSQADDIITGNGAANNLNGSAGDDILIASVGNDTLIGGDGVDIVDYGQLATKITLQAQGFVNKGVLGTDTVQAEVFIGNSDFANVIDAASSTNNSINADLSQNSLKVFGLPSGDVTFTVVNFQDVTGSQVNDIIAGNDLDNTLNGGAGADVLSGGTGNDSYYVDNAGDIVKENANEGTDTVFTTISYTLASNLENLTLLGTSAINATGNGLNNSLTGNNAVNTIDGGIGNDTLNGGGGNDILLGGVGADDLTGGIGNDLIYLGANDNAVDTVRYTAGHGIDTIYQFVRGMGGDKLNFTGIANFDVITSGTSTLVRVGDGIGGNTGFGTSQLLVTLSGTSGFTSANANLNLFGGNFLFN